MLTILLNGRLLLSLLSVILGVRWLLIWLLLLLHYDIWKILIYFFVYLYKLITLVKKHLETLLKRLPKLCKKSWKIVYYNNYMR
jgi:hypothetical protein